MDKETHKDIAHLELLLKLSLNEARNPHASVADLFLNQANRIRDQLDALKEKANKNSKLKKRRKK